MSQTHASLRDKKILVTGGAGFVGSHIVSLLVTEGAAEIVVVDNLVRGRTENLNDVLGDPRVKFFEGDIRDRSLMLTLMDDVDTVFHQAALRITHCAAEPRAALQVMVDATFDLVEFAAQKRVRKVVAASSASVYGLADTFPTPEAQHPYDNRTLYGAAKLFNEGLFRAFHDMHGLDYVALRYFNVYGPRMDIHGRYTEVMIRWMERIEAGLPPLIFGDGLQTLDMIHVEDVARANILAATSGASDVALNIGSSTETSLVELARLTTREMGRPDLVPLHEAERAVNPVPRRLADVRLARDLIGFESRIDLAAGIRGLVSWWRAERGLDGRRRAAE
ncbi:NAD-dependent epimerase/dehydratase family protein [Chenggangzhangella methanolivorans]|uniref:NAD-dependent epimerase/dehydratase family protein n=1 Tax=Chenggangzhangella methanolivorans TaxID=1437009 RepID=A0A9E6UNM3_9HYPH|nr:NAD-dependent epimerase/dehydratase family protein [Chenggangzhangella methanolivorans]QZO01276.1 NAD-dependent epimerase/dehydratase family protein [Chenggangzhangella methanolivorans]